MSKHDNYSAAFWCSGSVQGKQHAGFKYSISQGYANITTVELNSDKDQRERKDIGKQQRKLLLSLNCLQLTQSLRIMGGNGI